MAREAVEGGPGHAGGSPHTLTAGKRDCRGCSKMANWIPAAFDFVVDRWDSRSGLIMALFVLVVVLLVTFAGVDVSKIQPTEWAIVILSCLGLSFLWWWHRLPRVPKNKLGFGVAIAFEHSDHAQKLRSDFILILRDLLLASQLSQRFHFVEFGASAARGIVDADDATRLARRCNLHFLLHGRARLRNLPNGPAHVINLSGVVRHRPIGSKQSQQFNADFGAALPRRLIVDSDGDVLLCEFAASHIDAVSRYVIGTAAILSSDWRFAEELLLDAESTLQGLVKVAEGAPPAVLLDRVQRRIRDLYRTWLDVAIERHKRSRDNTILQEVDAVCNKLKEYEPDNYQRHVSAALVAFTVHNDIVAARRELEACHKYTDATWRYSEAFLHAFNGDLQNAYKSYSKAFRSPLRDLTVPMQCEEFIQGIIDREPQRKWLYYCVGLINYQAKGDLEAALRDFKQFVDSADPERFRRQIRSAERWMRDIAKRLDAS